MHQSSPVPAAWRRCSLAAVVAALFLLGSALSSFAQANANPPTKMTYQGFLTDVNGLPLGNTAPINKTIIFRIFDALVAGNRIWAAQQTVTIDKGHFSVLLGEGSAVGSEPFNSDLSSYFTGSGASDRFLELTVDAAVIAPRVQFFSAPYAFLASVARRAIEVDGVALTSGTIGDARLSANVAKLGSEQTFTAVNTFNNDIKINGTRVIRLGADVAGKEGNSGIIGYQTFTTGALDIVGAGQNSPFQARRIKLWAEGGAEVTGTVTATSFSGNGITPIGGIIMWSGATTAIPVGWALCDGSKVGAVQTPDLRNRFLVGAGNGYAVGATGGNSSIRLAVEQLPSHNHTFTDAYFAENQGFNAGMVGSKGGYDQDNQLFTRGSTTDSTGRGDLIDIRPPYYALAFIIRTQ